MRGPSRHLSWNELACWNRLGAQWRRWQPGELIAPYPQEWREDRAIELGITFESIRMMLGNKPIVVTSGYRTQDYNRAVSSASLSQHTQGRALDIKHPTFGAADLYLAILQLQRAGKLPHLGGLGSYKTFVHIDVRPKVNGRLSVWAG